MKKIIASTIVLIVSMAAIWPAHARDEKKMLPIAAAYEVKNTREKLDGSVKFFFGEQKHPAILNKLGSDISNRKTGPAKSEEEACNIAFLSALISFEKRAKELDANAVVNIVSYYKKDAVSSTTEFECHAGVFVTGVALKGDFVKIADK